MSNKKLPQHIVVRKLAANNTTLAGSLEKDQLPRVSGFIVDTRRAFEVEMRFFLNDESKPALLITLDGTVQMECQRCLQPTDVNIAISSRLVVAHHDEEARHVRGEYDPIVLDDGQLDIYSLVEEEILLALPIVCLHESTDSNCEEAYIANDKYQLINHDATTNVSMQAAVDDSRVAEFEKLQQLKKRYSQE